MFSLRNVPDGAYPLASVFCFLVWVTFLAMAGVVAQSFTPLIGAWFLVNTTLALPFIFIATCKLVRD